MRPVVDKPRSTFAAGALLCVLALAAGSTTTLRADTCGSYLHSISESALNEPLTESRTEAHEPVAPTPAECHGPRCKKGAPRPAAPSPPAPSPNAVREWAAPAAPLAADPPFFQDRWRRASNDAPIIVALDQLDPPPR